MNCLSQEDGSDLYGMGSTVKPVFEVGPTVNACTRGLWLHPSQVSLRPPDGSKLRVIQLGLRICRCICWQPLRLVCSLVRRAQCCNKP